MEARTSHGSVCPSPAFLAAPPACLFRPVPLNRSFSEFYSLACDLLSSPRAMEGEV
jgi:hypothetical protein